LLLGQGLLNSKPLLLPGRNFINASLALSNVAAFGGFMATANPIAGNHHHHVASRANKAFILGLPKAWVIWDTQLLRHLSWAPMPQLRLEVLTCL